MTRPPGRSTPAPAGVFVLEVGRKESFSSILGNACAAALPRNVGRRSRFIA